MVGRELQKIRPYGEDHRGLVRGREEMDRAGRHNHGKKIRVLKKLTAMKMMVRVLD